jgi:uncharacterized protein (TIGR02594 family)
MRITRRVLLANTLAFSVTPAFADDREEYLEYPFRDYFSRFQRGRDPSLDKDIDAANRIAESMPKDDPLNIMQQLSKIVDVGSTGEAFNMRWKKFANPLIVRFFHDIGYKKTPDPGDCTSWCAATVAWCLHRAGLPIPKDPASSQSFLRYGTKVSSPNRGDLCVFTDVNDRAHGHIGFFVDRSGEKLSVLGGNQSGESMTNCGPGYRKSKIDVVEIPINSSKDRSVGIHYLAAYVRPG